MYFLQNFIIWIRKNILRFLLREYPNKLLKPSIIIKDDFNNQTNFISSTDNFWVSRSMYKKWEFYGEFEGINLNIYSNKQVNCFMKEYFKNDLIFEIFKKCYFWANNNQ